MALRQEEILWKDRKHWLWFPFSFTKYHLTKTHLHIQRGFFNTTYDETLLYRVVDVSLSRSLGQKICGTGTVTVFSRVDTQKAIELKNIKKCHEVNRLISDMVEEIRNEKNVVGKEFYGVMGGGMRPDMDGFDDGFDDGADGE